MSKENSTTINEPSNKNEFEKYYKLQDNNIHLQTAYRSSFEEIIEVLSKFKDGSEKWKEKWRKYCANHQSKIEGHKQIWKLFSASISYIDIYTDQISGIIENLQRAYESIPKPKKHETLKFKIKEARADVDKLEKRLKELNEQKNDLDHKIKKSEDSSSHMFFTCINSQTRLEDLKQQQETITVSIEDTKESLQRKKDTFNKKKEKLYKKSKEDEIHRCQRLKEQSRAFLTAFNINLEDFDGLCNQYDPLKDFSHWEENIFHRNTNRPHQSRSAKNGTSFDKDEEE